MHILHITSRPQVEETWDAERGKNLERLNGQQGGFSQEVILTWPSGCSHGSDPGGGKYLVQKVRGLSCLTTRKFWFSQRALEDSAGSEEAVRSGPCLFWLTVEFSALAQNQFLQSQLLRP